MQSRTQVYWRANVRMIVGLLALWFFVGLGCGILWIEPLNKLSIGGMPLGFWMAQQGSIYVFVLMVFFYAWRMDRLDRHFEHSTHRHDEEPHE